MGPKYNTRQRMTSPYVSVSDSFVLDISVSKAVATSAPKNATLEGTLLYKFPTTVVEESFEATWDSDEQHYDVVSSSISATISDSEKIKVTYDGQVYTLYNDSSESHLEVDEDDDLVIESGLLSGDWTISGRIFRVKDDDENEIFPNYSTTINITQNSSYPEFLVVESGVSDDGSTRTTQGVTVGLLELDEDYIMLTLVDYDDNGIFTFTGIEKDTAGNIIKFTSGKYLESGFTNESTDALNQMPTVGVVTLEKV
jgi:hypothetical protein